MIDPASVAFDIDGVLADTMSLFIDIARDEFGLEGIRYEDITSYNLIECLGIDRNNVDAIILKILDGSYTASLKPIEGAPEVLTRLGRKHGPVLFVTARPYPGPLYDWIQDMLPLEPGKIEIITTGSFEGKAEILLKRNISYFVEDRLETCFNLEAAGIIPVLFKQPWNRKNHPFPEVSDWHELEALIEY